jgi:Fe2+ transport system protein B
MLHGHPFLTSLLGFLFESFPILLAIAAWLWFMARSANGQKVLRGQMQQQNAILERIAKALEQRGAA